MHLAQQQFLQHLHNQLLSLFQKRTKMFYAEAAAPLLLILLLAEVFQPIAIYGMTESRHKIAPTFLQGIIQ